MGCCKNPKTKDLTQGLGPDRHMYCEKCKAHEWQSRQYSKKEWEKWMEETDVRYRK